MKKVLYAFMLTSFSASIASATNSDCAISYRQDGAAQLLETSRIGVTNGAPYDSRNYQWLMGIAVQVPDQPIKSATIVIPTIGSGYQGEYTTTTATVYATLSKDYGSLETCSGYGPQFVGLKKGSTLAYSVGQISQSFPAQEIRISVNSTALNQLNLKRGQSVVFGVQMNVLRKEVMVPGETDPKKVNLFGTVVDFNHAACKGSTWSTNCPIVIFE